MLGEHHYLPTDLPEYKDKIHRLKLDDTHFSKLYGEYAELDKAIYRIEEGIEVTSDAYLVMLKKQRVILKDELYDMLKRLERSRAVFVGMEKKNELLVRQKQLIARLESMEADYHCDLDAHSSDKFLRQENALVLNSIASAAAEEFARIERKLE